MILHSKLATWPPPVLTQVDTGNCLLVETHSLACLELQHRASTPSELFRNSITYENALKEKCRQNSKTKMLGPLTSMDVALRFYTGI